MVSEKSTPLLTLAGLSHRQIAQVADQLTWRSYAAGSSIPLREAFQCTECLVFRGSIEVVSRTNGPPQSITRFQAGQIVDNFLQNHYPSSVELRAVEDTVLCFAGCSEAPKAAMLENTKPARSKPVVPSAGQSHRRRVFRWYVILLCLVVAGLMAWKWQGPWRTLFAQITYGLAAQQLESGGVAGALPLLEASLSFDPNISLARNDLGYIYFQQGKLSQAEGFFRAAVAADPVSAVAQNNLGLSYFSSGQTRSALAALQRATELNPEDLNAWINLGIVAQRAGQTQEAIRAYLAVLRLNPHMVTAEINLGTLYYDQNLFADAQRFLAMAQSIQPNLPQVRLMLGAIALSQRNYKEAWNEWQAAQPQLAADPSFHFYRGLWYEEQGVHDKAREEYQRVLDLSPGPNLWTLAQSHLIALAP